MVTNAKPAQRMMHYARSRHILPRVDLLLFYAYMPIERVPSDIARQKDIFACLFLSAASRPNDGFTLPAIEPATRAGRRALSPYYHSTHVASREYRRARAISNYRRAGRQLAGTIRAKTPPSRWTNSHAAPATIGRLSHSAALTTPTARRQPALISTITAGQHKFFLFSFERDDVLSPKFLARHAFMKRHGAIIAAERALRAAQVAIEALTCARTLIFCLIVASIRTRAQRIHATMRAISSGLRLFAGTGTNNASSRLSRPHARMMTRAEMIFGGNAAEPFTCTIIISGR